MLLPILFDGSAAAGHAQQQQMRLTNPLLKNLTAVEAFQILLPLAEVDDLASHDLSAPAVAQTGVRLLALMLLAVTGSRLEQPISRCLQACWVPAMPQAEKMLNAALILCADHELNASSFSARCIASTGATPYGAVMGGIAALQGPRHGGGTVRCETFLREAAVNVRQAIINRLKLEDHLPGFGHRLYPTGDPRGRYLMDLVLTQLPDAPVSATLNELAGEIERSFGLHPTLDLGLVALSLALELPSGSALTLFALGRLAGWVGHIMEQYETGQMIRPRARYLGDLPSAQ